MKSISRGVAALATLALATSVQASEGLMCSGEGATVEVALGRLVVVGVLGGWTLTAVAIRLLITGPGGGRVEPPLRLVLDPALLSGITGGALLATGLAAALVAGAAYRSALPVPPESELR